MIRSILLLMLAAFFPMCQPTDHREFSGEPGRYPGNPEEDFSPVLVADHSTYRNLAFNRPAYHSSSFDYNQTAQLVTDGIIDSNFPEWLSVSTSETGVLPKNEREWAVDHNWVTNYLFDSTLAWLQVETGKTADLPPIDSVGFYASLTHDELKKKGWEFGFYGSENGKEWNLLAAKKGLEYPGYALTGEWAGRMPKNYRLVIDGLKLTSSASYRIYRLELRSSNAVAWTLGGLELYHQGQQVEIAPSHSFTSAWRSEGTGDEWIYVDLGATCSFDKIYLHWIRNAGSGKIQVSDDAISWNDIQEIKPADKLEQYILTPEQKGRYVRLLLDYSVTSDGYVLSEMEIFGKGGLVPKAKRLPAIRNNRRMDLAGGGWKLQRQSMVGADGENLSLAGYDDNEWIIATVPGTVLSSYRNIGAIPDPNYSDNQLMISESFFYSDFWYRIEFEVPSSFSGNHTYLNFDGINWKAEIFLNGQKLGNINGAFIRGKFDISDLIKKGEKNALAVKILKNDNPGVVKEQTAESPDKNGGILGADNPTFHATIGWDWIPTIRGRDIGIWNDVFLTLAGPVTINDPFVRSTLPLPDTSSADVSIEVTLENFENSEISGVLKGQIGSLLLEQEVTIGGHSAVTVRMDPTTHPALHLEQPKLWWPKGYGEPNLYDVELQFLTGNHLVSDSKSFKTGIRQMTFTEENDILKIWINGRRFIGRGGNWGFPESNLNYRKREYDIAVRYHNDMNFTMIRNWVGQTGDEEFFEACDTYGILIWQDFWLANPYDGPDPGDNNLFMDNARDFILKIRNHPSIGLYCGRNEGNPPEVLDTALRNSVKQLHPGLHYISNSAFGGLVSGGGPYRSLPPKLYFQERATDKFHSEMGMPNIVNYESLELMMPESGMWPVGRMWGIHDFCTDGAQGGASFLEQVEKSMGKAGDAETWTEYAQWINYRGYRAMFEAQSKNRMGLLLWMSHSAWPSNVWQTYDYYFDPTAAYFACKKASEPLHIQWNPLTDTIEVVNYHSRYGRNVKAVAELINLDGVIRWSNGITLDCMEDSMVKCFKLEYPETLSDVHFIRLRLTMGDQVLSENFYWRGLEKNNQPLADFYYFRNLQEYDLRALRTVPAVEIDASTVFTKSGDRWEINTHLKNNSSTPALMIRLKAIGKNSGDRILPVLYGDNYFFLMPGEDKTVHSEVNVADTRGEPPAMVITGFNVKELKN